jgi:hypothetical protein
VTLTPLLLHPEVKVSGLGRNQSRHASGWSLILNRSRIFISTLERLDRLWSSLGLLSNGYGVPSLVVKRARCEADHLAEVKIGRVIFLLHQTSS